MTDNQNQFEQARESANEAILQAEKYRAEIEQPQGRNLFQNLPQGRVLSDDDFFHITCHVDSATKKKIENSEFIELEKLLPKDRTHQRSSAENRMDLVNKDGSTYFVPHDRDQRILNVRRWEQAFWVYAAIYSAANPHRSAEIWQYVFIINSAASSYAWENVAYYDYTFRQLMPCNPERSWAKTYLQMWNLAMHDPIVKNNSNNNTFS